jgi:broad specificity phosphatase PhoE
MLNVKAIHQDDCLRERYFGKLELTSCSNYEKVWKEDSIDPSHKKWQVESVYEVLNRVTSLVLKINNELSGENVILISHGDVCHILLAGLLARDIREHFRLDPLETGELREISFKTTDER